MVVCEQWLANDFLARAGHEPGPSCDCPDCPPVRREQRVAAHAVEPAATPREEEEIDAWW